MQRGSSRQDLLCSTYRPSMAGTRSSRTKLCSLHTLFLVRSILSLPFSLSNEVKLYGGEEQRSNDGSEDEEPLISEMEDAEGVPRLREKRSLPPNISKESRAIVIKLCCLFEVDSLASGLVPASWVTYFFYGKFCSKKDHLEQSFQSWHFSQLHLP